MFKQTLLILILTCSALVQAQQQPAQSQSQRVYKWTDDEGKVQYSEVPPPNHPYEALNRPLPTSQTPPDATVKEPQEKTEEKAHQETEQPKQNSQERQQQIAKNCEIARTNLKALKGDQPVVRQDAEGKRFILSPEEKDTALKQALKDEQYFCKP